MAAFGVRACLASRPLVAEGRLPRARPPLVDAGAGHPILAPHRAPAAAHPGEHAPLLLRRHRADQHPADLLSAGAAPSVLQHDRDDTHADRDRAAPPAGRDRAGGDAVCMRSSGGCGTDAVARRVAAAPTLLVAWALVDGAMAAPPPAHAALEGGHPADAARLAPGAGPGSPSCSHA